MLTPADRDAIAAVFDLGTARRFIGPVARGVLGQIWRLETDRGPWAVKEWFEAPDAAEIEAGSAFQVAAMAYGVPAPPVIRSIQGDLLALVDGVVVAVQGWVDLRERDPMIDATSVGSVLAALHHVPFDNGQPLDAWYTEAIGSDRWNELADSLLAAGAPFAEQLESMVDELGALDELVVPPRDLRTCHRDLWADNVRATTTGTLCVIDWEDCGLADPSMELALVLFEFAGTDVGRARHVMDAYVREGGPGRIADAGAFSMSIAQIGHIAVRACEEWLDPEASEEDRGLASQAFQEFAGLPLTRAVIDRLVEAVAGWG